MLVEQVHPNGLRPTLVRCKLVPLQLTFDYSSPQPDIPQFSMNMV